MVSFTEENGTLCCRFSGQMNTNVCTGIENELLKQINLARGSVLFDLAEVSYMASSFLRLCVTAAKQLGGDRFSIVNVSPELKKIFTIAGFNEIMRIS